MGSEAGMPNRLSLITLSLAAVLVGACTLPGAASPTPFTFPTPNLTLTAVFAAVGTSTPSPQPTSTAIPPTATRTPSEIPTQETPEATSAAGSSASSRPNGTLVTAAFLAGPPTIDGSLSDWDTSAYTVSYVVYGSGARSGANDLSAKYYIGWDPTYLYLGVEVTDDKFVQISQGRSLYKGDEVEVQLDAALTADFSSTTLSADDYQIGLSPGDFDSIEPEAYRWYPSSKAGSLTSVVVKSASTTSGYNLEARIPWTVFGVTPQSGDHYGFALSVSDDDQAGKAIQESLISSVSTRKLLDPTTWGTLELEPSGGS
jgi:hypothetical protein